jgi:hypothetical protein
MANVFVHLVPRRELSRQSCPILSDSGSTCKSTNKVKIHVRLSPLPQRSGLQHYSHYQSTRSMEKRHLQNLTVAQLTNKRSHFYSVLRSTRMFTRHTHWTLSWATRIQPTSSHCFSQNHCNITYFQLKSVSRNKYCTLIINITNRVYEIFWLVSSTRYWFLRLFLRLFFN